MQLLRWDHEQTFSILEYTNGDLVFAFCISVIGCVVMIPILGIKFVVHMIFTNKDTKQSWFDKPARKSKFKLKVRKNESN